MADLKDLPFPFDMSESIFVSHLGCLDGSACAILFEAAGGKRENVKFVPAGMLERFVKSDPIFQSDKFIFIVDLGVTSDKYGDTLEKRGNLVLIDHHQTSEHLDGRSWAHISRGPQGGQACGCELFRQYLVAHEIMGKKFDSLGYRNFTRVVDDNDRWLQKEPLSKDLIIMFAFLGQQEFVKIFRTAGVKFLPRQEGNLVREDVFDREELFLLEQLKRQSNEEVERLLKRVVVKQATFEDGSTYRIGYVITSEKNISELLNRVLTDMPEVDASCQINVDRGTVSLRSRSGSNVDVTKIATYFKGGGHRHAAGHRLPENLANMIISETHGLEED